MSTPTIQRPAVRPPAPTGRVARVRRRAPRDRRARFAYWLIAPALAFMVLVHLVPTAAGTFLSFLDLNTFTFRQLFGAPWTGLGNAAKYLAPRIHDQRVSPGLPPIRMDAALSRGQYVAQILYRPGPHQQFPMCLTCGGGKR